MGAAKSLYGQLGGEAERQAEMEDTEEAIEDKGFDAESSGETEEESAYPEG